MILRLALDALHKAGRIRSPWLPGMVWRRNDGTGFPVRLGDDGDQIGVLLSWGPDPTDPATAGCLGTLAREADGGGLFAVCDPETSRWRISVFDHEGNIIDPWPGCVVTGMTEGEAWAAALILQASLLN